MHVWLEVYRLNKPGRGTLGDATHQNINLKAICLVVPDKFFFHVFPKTRGIILTNLVDVH